MGGSYVISFNPNHNTYEPVVETVVPQGSSILQDAYEQAMGQIMDIVKGNAFKSQTDEEKVNYECNNIVAFSGERGSGKTSAMLSVGKTLEHNGLAAWASERDQSLRNHNFLVLKPINPGRISDQETVLDTVLCQMYNELKERNKKEKPGCCPSSELEDKRSLYQQFELIHKVIQVQCQDRKTYYDDTANCEFFINLAAGARLKDLLHELVEKYLRVMGETDLVIQIDDIDLSMDYAYTICEDIRENLSIPQVVVLFAVNMEQLYSLIQQKYCTSLDLLYHHGQDEYVMSRVPKMAEEYLRKLVPTKRRCSMPDLQYTSAENIEIKMGGNDACPLLKQILPMLYRKTGLILVPDRGNHPLIPQTLRGLYHLLTVLYDMEDITLFENGQIANDIKKPLFERQLRIMEQYFEDEVVLGLPQQEKNAIKLFKIMPNKMLNKHIIKSIYLILNSVKDQYAIGNSNLNKVEFLSDIPVPENITAGDVAYALRIFDKEVSGHELFTALIKAFYSLRATRILFLNNLETRTKELFYLLGGSIICLPYDEIVMQKGLFYFSVDIDDIQQENDALAETIKSSTGTEIVFSVGSFGKRAKSKNENWRSFISGQSAPSYEQLENRKSILNDSTYKYFSCGLPAALVFPLLDNNYDKCYLPLFSMDIICEYSANIRLHLANELKSSKPIVQAFVSATKNVIQKCFADAKLVSDNKEFAIDSLKLIDSLALAINAAHEVKKEETNSAVTEAMRKMIQDYTTASEELMLYVTSGELSAFASIDELLTHIKDIDGLSKRLPKPIANTEKYDAARTTSTTTKGKITKSVNQFLDSQDKLSVDDQMYLLENIGAIIKSSIGELDNLIKKYDNQVIGN